MMGMKKRMKRGGKAMKKRVKKKIGGTIESRRKKTSNEEMKSAMKDRGRGKGAASSKRVMSGSKVVRGFNQKSAVKFGGANKAGKKSREGRMGGGMMKKRMKRGGKAK